MRFEHLIEVNDLENPLQTALTREELWFGLLCRAEDARAFLPGLEACRVVERSDEHLVRDLHFGSAVIRDRVTFRTLDWICFESEANEEHAGGSLRITIEEPQQGALFLRFQYQTTLPEGGGTEDGQYAAFVRSAYHQSDIDTVRVIRMIAESGGLQQ
ncbi:SRPBCC family protein [Thauera sp. 2A1]|uniref:SRPBCC family protein n=1 Tax=Thauera sp. 2A1 TaxID=2570191 RepID=UPI00129256DD|nr:SRPBCC family protein [Thauera sp. 2A1]KAI5915668.1 SRPBCC family protein [Thauera sp. 2A1]